MGRVWNETIERKTPLRSRKGLKRSPIKRNKSVNRVNKRRRQKRYERAYGGDAYRGWIHSHECFGCGRSWPIHAAHVRTGGVGTKADARHLVPLCGSSFSRVGCHSTLDDGGISAFEDRTGLTREDLDREAARLWREFHEEEGE